MGITPSFLLVHHIEPQLAPLERAEFGTGPGDQETTTQEEQDKPQSGPPSGRSSHIHLPFIHIQPYLST